MSSKLTAKTPGRGQFTSFGIFFGNFSHISRKFIILMEGMIRLVRTQNFPKTNISYLVLHT